MRTIRILVMVLLGLIVVTLLGGCGIGGSIAATPNPPAVFPEVPSLQDFNTIGGYMAAVEAYPARLDAAHDGAVTEAAANRDRKVAKADAKFESEVAKIRDNFAKAESSANARAKHRIGAVASNDDVSFNEAVVKAEAILEADHVNALASARKSYDEAEKVRDAAVAKAKAAYNARKGELASEMERRLADSKAERDLIANIGSVDNLQQQVKDLSDRVAELEAAPLAAPAVPCAAQPAFTG